MQFRPAASRSVGLYTSSACRQQWGQIATPGLAPSRLAQLHCSSEQCTKHRGNFQIRPRPPRSTQSKTNSTWSFVSPFFSARGIFQIYWTTMLLATIILRSESSTLWTYFHICLGPLPLCGYRYICSSCLCHDIATVQDTSRDMAPSHLLRK